MFEHLSLRMEALFSGVRRAWESADLPDLLPWTTGRTPPAGNGRSVFTVPPRPPGTGSNGVLECYWLIPPHAYAEIVRDEEAGLKYCVIEPELTPHEYILLKETYEYLRDVLIYDTPGKLDVENIEYEDVAKAVRQFDREISDERLEVIYYYQKRNFLGYGKIDPMMHDAHLEDISCSGHGVPVYAYHRGYSSIQTNILFESDEINRFILKLAQKADKQISLSTPLVDAALPCGSRIQLTFSDVVSTRGSSFTIRKFSSEPMTPADLIRYGTYSPEILAFIWLAVENRKSMIIVGGTASGKTSSMNAISFFIPLNAKIVSLEDTREIQLPHKNWLPSRTREVNAAASIPDIDLFALLRSALRQRPEYIIVGEVRGSEAQTLFQAMNTGHTTFSTLHAGMIEEAVNRLIHDPINVPAVMFGALDLITVQSIHYLNGKVVRRCDAVHEVYVDRNGEIGWNTLYTWERHADTFRRVSERSRVLESIAETHGWSDSELEAQLDMRRRFLSQLPSGQGCDAVALMAGIHNVGKMNGISAGSE